MHWCEQQVGGGASPSLFSSSETSLGVLHPVLGPQYKNVMDLLGASPEEGHEDGQRGWDTCPEDRVS